MIFLKSGERTVKRLIGEISLTNLFTILVYIFPKTGIFNSNFDDRYFQASGTRIGRASWQSLNNP
jgi:hypothetical protein